jgi:RNA polymerase sigma-70 factor (ECF subfamily)
MPGVDAREQERRRIASAQAGDEQAWRALFDEHYPKLYAFMRRRVGDRETAEDLAAETFVDAFRGLPRFRWRGKPFGAWLFTVARNRLRMHYRSHSPGSVALSEWDGVARDETLTVAVDDALSRLSAEYREALELRYVIGLSGAEAAAAMGRSHGAFRMLLLRATQAFKTEYGSLD